MNKKIVTLACVTLLSGFVAGVNADELSLGVSVDSKEDTAGLVVAEQPKEESPAVDSGDKTEGENLCDDLELVAVITAAIAEFSGNDASSLIVRSIKRVKR